MAATLAVLEAQLVNYRRVWRGSALSSFLMPLLFVIGFGLSVGHFVDAAGRLGSVRYLDYLTPGMVASTAMQVGFGEASWPVLGRFNWTRTYHAIVATPVRVTDLLAGELLFVALRVLISSSVFLAVAAAFGAVHSLWALAVPLACALTGLATASPVYAYSGRSQTDTNFALLMRFIVIPMSLFAGVYFPVTALPAPARALAYASPLWHAVEVCRAGTLGTPIGLPAVAGHLAYLCLWIAGGFALARRSFRRRLVT